MEPYWKWENYVKNIIAGLIFLANILLIFTIRSSAKCRTQVFIQMCLNNKIVYIQYIRCFVQRFSLVIVSLAVIDMIVGIIIPINTLRKGR